MVTHNQNRIQAFFILGCPRSGTTAVSKMLDTSINADVFIEQDPKLCIESRELSKGLFDNPLKYIATTKKGKITITNTKGKLYGDKNPNYLPFIPYLENLWQPKYVLVVRDGRDVVRSMLSGRKIRKGGFYSLPEDNTESKISDPKLDYWDYSRLRPNHGEPFYENWRAITVFEKACWLWANYNNKALKYFKYVPKDRWLLLYIDDNVVNNIEKCFGFLDLDGFNYETISKLAKKKINSIYQKTNQPHDIPHYSEWDEIQKNIFAKHAGEMMTRLSFWNSDESL